MKKLGLIPVVLAFATLAHGQQGVCKDPWITQAYHQLYGRAPVGSAGTGECDITRYNNGHWTTYQDLTSKVKAYQDLLARVAAEEAARRSAQQPSLVRPGTVNSHSTPVVAPSATTRNGSGLISDAGGNAINRNNIISQDGGGLVSGAHGTVVSNDGGSLVGASGGTMRSVQSVDAPRASTGKYLVIPGGNLVDQNGGVVRRAGTYMLVVRNGNFAIGTGAGARAPVAGNVVLP